MHNCDYNELKIEHQETKHSKQWIYLLRQLYVCSGCYVIFFVLGLCFGAPTVFIPQIRKEANSTEAVSLEMESWLTCIHGYSALPFVIIIPIISQFIGRKIPFIVVCANTIVCFIIFYWSKNVMQLLISEILEGILLASNMTLLVVILAEYTSSHYRGILMSSESSIFFWGVWVANAAGTFSHWRNIGLIAFVCCTYCLSSFFWPESPSWLAMKGRFDECAAAHHWLKGYDKESEKELKSLIDSQRKYLEECSSSQIKSFKEKLKTVIQTITSRSYYGPVLLNMAVISLYHFSGKMVCTMYAIELIRQITQDEYTGYIGMLILEGVTIIGMQVGCVLSKYLKRRTLLIVFSLLGIVHLFIISLYLYLINLGLFIENKYVSISLLMMFSVSISIGPIVIPTVLFGELISLRHRSSSLLLLCLYSEFLMASVLKISPYIFKLLQLHGAFFFYGVSASIFTYFLNKYLPETKDKTLQEIERFFVDKPEKRHHSTNK